MDINIILSNWPYLLGGIGTTISLSVLAILLSGILGLALGIIRCYASGWATWPVVFYIDSLRAVPVLVLIVWGYFIPPLLFGVTFPPFHAALLALTLQSSAYAAEVVRAGISSVSPGQTRAGLSLGMSPAQIVARIVLPQGLVRMLPAFSSLISIVVKNTAIASVVGVTDVTYRAGTVASTEFRTVEVFTFVILVYFLILYPIMRGLEALYQRISFLGRS